MSSSHKRDPFGSTPNHNQVAAKCVCNRPTTTVFCTACKAMCEGRVYSVCCVHPNVCRLYNFSYVLDYVYLVNNYALMLFFIFSCASSKT